MGAQRCALNNRTAGQIMTPRPVLVTVPGEKNRRELADELTKLGFSRLPVISAEGVDHASPGSCCATDSSRLI
jgi:CBS domain containing-hemolysin-like protein